MKRTSKHDPALKTAYAATRPRRRGWRRLARRLARVRRMPRAEFGALTRHRPRRWWPVRREQVLGLGLTATLSLALWGMFINAAGEYRRMQTQVNVKEAQLTALKAQHQVAQRRLAGADTLKEREQVLLDHDYIRPGDRLLIFPLDRADQERARLPKNDLAPHPPLPGEAADTGDSPSGSGWQGAGHGLSEGWRSLRGGNAATPQPQAADTR